MKINIENYGDDNIEDFLELIKSSGEEKIEINIEKEIPTFLFQIIACNMDKFNLTVNNPLMEQIFKNLKVSSVET